MIHKLKFPKFISITLVLVCFISSCCSMLYKEKYFRSHNYNYGFLDSLPSNTKMIFEGSGITDTATYGILIQKYSSESSRGSQCIEEKRYYYDENQAIIFQNKLGFKTLQLSRSTNYVDDNYNPDPMVYPNDSSIIKISLQIDTLYAVSYFKGKKESFVFNGKKYKDCKEISFNGFAKILYHRKLGVLRIRYFEGGQETIFTAKEIISK